MRRSEMIATHRSPRADAGAMRASHGPRPRVAESLPAEAAFCDGGSGQATLTRRRAAAISVVGLHDSLDELMTHHVALVEIDERNAIDFADDFHRLHET